MPATSWLLCAGLRSSQCTLSIVHAKAMCMRYSSNNWIMPASSASERKEKEKKIYAVKRHNGNLATAQ